jgi:ribose-phosphate pyrophosphokinase
MTAVVIAMPGNEALADQLAAVLALERVAVTVRRFPDGESSVRVDGAVEGRQALVVCTLDRPDAKLVPLFLLSHALREAGAAPVGLVAPYLPYMRQDIRFHPGETISAAHVAGWIGREFNWLVTVDPHLHRITDLAQVYTIPTRVVHAAADVAMWVKAHVRQPLLVGPDEESAQWVSEVARGADAPFIVLAKERRGDRDVVVSVPDAGRWLSHTPVLFDDIVSTARTMIETVGHLHRAGLAAPVCVTVHAIFADPAFADLRAAGAGEIVSCDTIVHPSNRIALAQAIGVGVREMLARASS